VHIYLRLLLLCLCFSFSFQGLAQSLTTERIYTQVDCMPQLANCAGNADNMYKLDRCTIAALKQWFLNNMNYPISALSDKFQEKISFKILLDTSGSITVIEPMQEMNTPCSEEALRLMQLLKTSGEKWTPGKQGKKKVAVAMEVAIDFNLNDWNLENEKRTKSTAIKQDSLLKNGVKTDSIPKKKK